MRKLKKPFNRTKTDKKQHKLFENFQNVVSTWINKYVLDR